MTEPPPLPEAHEDSDWKKDVDMNRRIKKQLVMQTERWALISCFSLMCFKFADIAGAIPIERGSAEAGGVWLGFIVLWLWSMGSLAQARGRTFFAGCIYGLFFILGFGLLMWNSESPKKRHHDEF